MFKQWHCTLCTRAALSVTSIGYISDTYVVDLKRDDIISSFLRKLCYALKLLDSQGEDYSWCLLNLHFSQLQSCGVFLLNHWKDFQHKVSVHVFIWLCVVITHWSCSSQLGKSSVLCINFFLPPI